MTRSTVFHRGGGSVRDISTTLTATLEPTSAVRVVITGLYYANSTNFDSGAVPAGDPANNQWPNVGPVLQTVAQR